MLFAPLHNHTMYSAFDGVATPVEIAKRCLDIGCGAVACTDHGVVSGHIDFDKTIRTFGLKPIFGMEAYHGLIPGKPPAKDKKAQRDQHHFVLLAASDEGLRNLWRYADAASYNSHFVDRGHWDMYRQFSEGIYATSACLGGVLSQAISEELEYDPYEALNLYRDIYGDRFFIEIHTYPGEHQRQVNRELVSIAQEWGIGMVYATDAHYATEDQYDLFDAYSVMRSKNTVYDDPEDRSIWHPNVLYIKDEDEIREALDYLPESVVDECLANSALIADKCNASLPEVRPHLPIFVPSECPWLDEEAKKKEATELFLDLVEKGLHERYGEISDEIWERAEYEVGTFMDAGLIPYFLQAWDFTQEAIDKGYIRGPGRGSAPSSVVAYALGLTGIDPLKYGLYFERFWNPGRAKGFPDIDFDYPRTARKKMHDYMRERHGKEKISVIGTVTRLKPKVTLERLAKSLRISHTEVDAVKRIVEKVPDIEIIDVDTVGWSRDSDPGALKGYEDGKPIFQPKERYVWDEVGDEITEWVDKQPLNRQDALWNWLDIVDRACSRVSGYGVHPSGVVISDADLADELPGMYNANLGAKVTQFPMDIVDARRFVKNDYLGLRNLDTLDEWTERVAKKGVTVDWSKLDSMEHPEEMWRLLERGFTMGIFQIEDSFSARKLAKEIKPRSVEDMGIVAALNRPGPLRSGAAESYIRRRNGDEDVTYEHPILEPILKETLGVMVYQEQILSFCRAIGYDAGDGDAVRKMLGKKDNQAMRAFIEGTHEWSGKGYMKLATEAGISRDVAQSIIDKIALFALYSFNKSHSICYGILGLWTLYAKYHNPAEFYISAICTLQSEDGKSKDPNLVIKTAAMIGEARRMGIDVLPPDIKYSNIDIDTAEDGNIYFGFSNIKGIGVQVARNVCEFRDTYEFDNSEEFGDAMAAAQADWVEGGKIDKSPVSKINAKTQELLYSVGAFANYEDMGLKPKQRQLIEQELLGMILTDTSKAVYARNERMVEACDDWEEFIEDRDIEKSQLPGTIRGIRITKVKKSGSEMAIVTIEYQGYAQEVAVFTKQWQQYKEQLKELTTGIFTLRKNERGCSLEKVLILK